jgi:hypothetical protein
MEDPEQRVAEVRGRVHSELLHGELSAVLLVIGRHGRIRVLVCGRVTVRASVGVRGYDSGLGTARVRVRGNISIRVRASRLDGPAGMRRCRRGRGTRHRRAASRRDPSVPPPLLPIHPMKPP